MNEKEKQGCIISRALHKLFGGLNMTWPKVESYYDGDTYIYVDYKKTGTGVLRLTDGQGNVHRIRLTVDENKNIDEKLID